SVTITVEDRAGRDPKAFEQELVRIQTKLECVVEERDFLRQRVSSMFPEGFTKAAEFLAAELLARPSQIVHIHNPRALQQTAHRLGRADGAPSSSWRPQGRHSRLLPIPAPPGVDGAPAPAMTTQQRLRVPTCVR